MKIDFLSSSMEAGGAQRVISILAEYLVKKGYQVRIITFRGDDHYQLDKRIERIRLHRQPLFQSVIFNGFFNLMTFYRKKANRPDIISSHVDLLGLVTIPNSILYKIKIIVSEHNNHLAYNNIIQKFIWNYLYPKVDIVTILTKFDKDHFLKLNKNTIVVPNPSPFKVSQNINSNNTKKQEIVAIGSLDRYVHKGFDNLLTIVKRVFDYNPNWNLKIVGEGATGLKFLKNKAEQLKILDKVEFTGYRSDIKEILGNTEIFILSSRFEGLPMVLLEAMSQGAACISYDCISGPSDIITHNCNGILVENQNIDAMVSQLNELINNDSLRRRIKKNAPMAVDKFSIENVGKQWEQIFLRALAN